MMNPDDKDEIPPLERLQFAGTVLAIGSVLIFVLVAGGILRLCKFVLGLNRNEKPDRDSDSD